MKNNVGTILHGYCNGYFGRDDYTDKIIVFETRLAICCRHMNNDGLYMGEKYNQNWQDMLPVAYFDTEKEKQKYIDDWSSEKARKEYESS